MKRGQKMTPEQVAKTRAARWGGKQTPKEVLFWEKVDRRGPNDCWLWTSPAERKGYGVMMWHEGKIWYAHRISWLLAGNALEPGKVIDHICRTPKCVNPAHLRSVTPRVNAIENNLSPAATNARKERCPRGHSYTPENTRYYTPKVKLTRHGRVAKSPPRPQRICITCFRASMRAYYQRKKAEKQAVLPKSTFQSDQG